MTTGLINAGKLDVRNRDKLKAALASFPDGEVILTIERRHATRSRDQNAFYWGVCIHLVSEYTGYDPDEVHEIAKQLFLPKALTFADVRNGEVKGEFVVGGTTTTLNKIEFGEYMDRFRRWAAEDLGVVIPDPDPEHAG